ncbi:MAG: glycine cleavage system protein GcvH [Candidatus Aerophobetes bacterium]|nr:glycine cleavage system protein GcvH [Candidatus Aerophobetes bacterium]
MYPKDLRYTRTHEWAKADNDIAIIGITDFAIKQLTDLVYVELPSVGEKVTRGSPFGSIESVKAVSDLNSPVTGEVIEVNEELPEKPELITNDPYGEGWMVKVKIEDTSELDALMDSGKYEELVKKEEEEH